MSATMTAQLVTDALIMAIWRRGKALLSVVEGPDALSDQGSQYTSEQFQRLLKDNGVTCSMSRSGNCWDNTAIEKLLLIPQNRADQEEGLPIARPGPSRCVRLYREIL
jgi:transposase InsO family protein